MSRQWDQLIDRAGDQGGLAVGELYLGVQKIRVSICCDHSKAERPAALAEDRDRALEMAQSLAEQPVANYKM